MNPNRGEKNSQSKISDADAIVLKERALNGESLTLLAKEYQMSIAFVCQLKHGKARPYIKSDIPDSSGRPSGANHWLAKLDDDKVREILRRHKLGWSVGTLAEEHGVTSTTISSIIHGRTWRKIYVEWRKSIDPTWSGAKEEQHRGY